MIKKLFKGALCAALSLSMALGSVMVGASEKTAVSKDSIEAEMPKIEKPVSFKGKIQMKKSSRATAAPAYLNAVNIWNVNNWNNFIENQVNYAKIYDGMSSADSYEQVKVGTIHVGVNGTVMIPYYAEVNGQEVSLSLRTNAGGSISQSTSNGIIYASNLRAGDYALYTSSYKNAKIQAMFAAGAVSNQNNRWLGKTVICSAGTGNNNYQYFKVKKRGVAGIYINRQTSYGGTYGVSHYVQKKSGSKWKTVSREEYSSKSDDYSTVFGLSAGTYRLVSKGYTGDILFIANVNRTCNSSYGTKKKKAKTIKRKKYKKQTFLTTDSAKKSHWYKIKVSKKRTTYIDVTSEGSSGTIWCQISGKTRFKSKKIKNGKRFYAKAKKGTYYIKIYKTSKSTSGGYKVKYTK